MRKITTTEAQEYFRTFGYELIGEYTGSSKKLTLRCPKGHEYRTTYSLFKHQNTRCCYCTGHMRYNTEQISQYLDSIGYKMLSEKYENSHKKLKMICNNGHQISMTIHSLKAGQRCRYCVGNNLKYTYPEIKNIFAKQGYMLIDYEYKNNKQPLKVVCPSGHETKISLVHFNNGVRCQRCGASSGEVEIMSVLDKYKVQYVTQHTFDGCKDKQLLLFDFYIPAQNTCIEFDGAQHFKPIRTWGGNAYLEDRIRKDKIKDQYCKENDIDLIRISYKNFKNIEEILKKKCIVK